VRTALRLANVLEHGIALARASSVFHELDDAGLFASVYKREPDFLDALEGCSLINGFGLGFGLEIEHV